MDSTPSFPCSLQDSEAVSIISYLRKAGYTKLVLQIGTGSVEPLNLVKHATHDFAVEYFKFSHTFKDVIQTAGLVISHAGAGTILEVLRMPSPAPKLLVVVNTKLMDNHQLELAEALSQGSYLFHAEPHNVVETIRKSDWASIQPYPPIDSTAFPLLLAHEVSGS